MCSAALVFVLGSGAPLGARKASRISNQQGVRTDAAVLALEITSPANITVVAPGDTVTVKVTSSANTRFEGVSLLAEQPLTAAAAAVAEILPAQFSFRIPLNIPCRKYAVSAFGVTPAGQEFVASVLIDVEHSDVPDSIEADPPELDFAAGGDSNSFRLLGRFAGNTVLSIRESTKVTYTSLDPNVATVDARGVVTAVAEGETEVVATYGPVTSGVRTVIYVRVDAALLSIVPRVIAFGNTAVGTTSTQRVTVTNVRQDGLSIIRVTVPAGYSETDTCVRLSPLSLGASCAIAISFAPALTGPSDGIVTVDTSFQSSLFRFKLTGTGVPR